MTEQLLALGDMGASQTRVTLTDSEGFTLGVDYSRTDPADYEGSVQAVADKMQDMAGGRELSAASIAVAARVDHEGRLIQSGALSPWIGRCLGEDMATALDLPPELVGLQNDAAALALSQYEMNRRNGIDVEGAVVTFSSGWGGALFDGKGDTYPREPGHSYNLRPGAVCPCGEEGHAEAYISGKGVELNHGVSMKEWLKNPGAASELVQDMSEATRAFLEDQPGFVLRDLRWTGGVALNQPFVMGRVAEQLRRYMGHKAPHMDVMTMGDQAGLHGTFIDAKRRAAA